MMVYMTSDQAHAPYEDWAIFYEYMKSVTLASCLFGQEIGKRAGICGFAEQGPRCQECQQIKNQKAANSPLSGFILTFIKDSSTTVQPISTARAGAASIGPRSFQPSLPAG